MPISVVPEQYEFTGRAVRRSTGSGGQVLPYYAGTSHDPAINQSSQSGMLDLKLARSAVAGQPLGARGKPAQAP